LKRTSNSKMKNSPSIKKNTKIFTKLLRTTKNKIENSFSISNDKDSKDHSQNQNL